MNLVLLDVRSLVRMLESRSDDARQRVEAGEAALKTPDQNITSLTLLHATIAKSLGEQSAFLEAATLVLREAVEQSHGRRMPG